MHWRKGSVRANELALAGDDDGAATWRRIMAAVTELANKTPPGQLHETGQSLMRVNRPPYLHACPIAPVRLVPAIRGAMTQRQGSNLSGHSALHLKSSLPRRPAVQNGDYRLYGPAQCRPNLQDIGRDG